MSRKLKKQKKKNSPDTFSKADTKRGKQAISRLALSHGSLPSWPQDLPALWPGEGQDLSQEEDCLTLPAAAKGLLLGPCKCWWQNFKRVHQTDSLLLGSFPLFHPVMISQELIYFSCNKHSLGSHYIPGPVLVLKYKFTEGGGLLWVLSSWWVPPLNPQCPSWREPGTCDPSWSISFLKDFTHQLQRVRISCLLLDHRPYI